ncbi:Yip1 family protein [Ningiella sp. W23]|uniref:Yip1 family protein n=1 Tax=Ningiella sp. W23 TaxID=3023715 RepID=UPI003757DFAB
MTLVYSFFDVFTSPSSFFHRIKYGDHKGRWIFLLLTLSIFALYYSFYSVIDSEWLVQKQLAEIQDLPASQQEELARIFRNLAEYAGWLGTFLSSTAMLVAVALLSLFYMYMDSSDERKSYEQWFSFTLWTQAPTIISTLIFMIILFTIPEQDFRPELINYASVSQLLGIQEESGYLYLIGNSFSVFYIWSIVLATIGIRIWANATWLKSLLIAVTPYIVYVVSQIIMV